MGLVINTNIASLIATNNLSSTQGSLQKDISHLSSGLRIATAADDAAGLAISEKLKADTAAYQQAARNANDGISAMQVAEGGLSQVSNILTRMKELAVEAANGTTSDRTSLDQEFQQLKSEMVRIGNTTTFNGTDLLKGSFNTSLQVGLTSSETLGLDLASVDLTSSASASNAVKVLTTASVGAATNGVHTGTGTATSGGTYTGAVDKTYTITVGATVASSVGAATGAGGNTSTGAPTSGGAYTGTSDASYKIKITAGGTETTAKFQYSTDGGVTWNGSDITATGSAQALANGVTVTMGAGNYVANDSWSMAVTAAGTSYSWTSTDPTAESGAGTSTGSAITLSDGVTATLSQTGHAAGDTYTIAVTGSRNLSSQANAADTMAAIDTDIASISEFRGTIGSYQKRLGYTVANLQTMAQNTQASESQITDEDFATGMADFTKHQVLQQAGVAILSQANSLTQSVLKLLG